MTLLRSKLKSALAGVLAHTPLQFWPVRMRHSFLRGSRWTLWPHSAYWRGNYEPEVQAALQKHAPPAGGAAWDLGAHFGFYTLWLARAVGPTGQVCAFEPEPVSFDRLRRHVAMNQLDQVRLYHRAASEATGEEPLILIEGPGATTSHLAYQGETSAGQPTVSIKTVSLDQLFSAERLAPPRFIKIDVEGHAAPALRGARTVIAQFLPVILISLHSPDEVDGVRQQLEPLGYRPYNLADVPVTWPATLFQTVVLKT
ncbi:MAG: FkbM family methyltransferase [Verrucomicrobia bacterium]|nr:FkbM family methyltransferase [Verrucomicrobiota bacterium]